MQIQHARIRDFVRPASLLTPEMGTLFPQISTLFRGVLDKTRFPTVFPAFSREK